jgi:hypothetical protein
MLVNIAIVMKKYDINTVLTLKDYIDNNRKEYEAKRDLWVKENLPNKYK